MWGRGGIHTGVHVEPLLTRCWGSIIAVAKTLHRDAEIDHTDVLDALGLDEATAPMGLSSIRSGAPPGSFTITPPAA